jgi:hypothetical protein
LFRPPTPERVTEFFEFLRVRIATGIQASVVEPGGGGDRLEEDRLLGWSRQTVRSFASTTPLAVPGSLHESGVNLVSTRLLRQVGRFTKGHHHE